MNIFSIQQKPATTITSQVTVSLVSQFRGNCRDKLPALLIKCDAHIIHIFCIQGSCKIEQYALQGSPEIHTIFTVIGVYSGYVTAISIYYVWQHTLSKRIFARKLPVTFCFWQKMLDFCVRKNVPYQYRHCFLSFTLRNPRSLMIS